MNGVLAPVPPGERGVPLFIWWSVVICGLATFLCTFVSATRMQTNKTKQSVFCLLILKIKSIIIVDVRKDKFRSRRFVE